MLILIEDTERGFDIARGIWGAFSSCLYAEDDLMRCRDESLEYLIVQCAKSEVVLIVITSNVKGLKSENPQAFCIHCDGGDIKNENDKTLIFVKEDKRDDIVRLIIDFFKRKKLL